MGESQKPVALNLSLERGIFFLCVFYFPQLKLFTLKLEEPKKNNPGLSRGKLLCGWIYAFLLSLFALAISVAVSPKI